jgi:tetratricopeptide (TPR) repeat protein
VAATAAEASIARALAETTRGDAIAARTSWATANRLRPWDQDLWLRQGHAATYAVTQRTIPSTICLSPTQIAAARLPHSSEAAQDRAACLEANGDLVAATQVLASARLADPTNVDLLLLSGVIAARSGDLAAAEELLLRATRLAPDAAAPWINLALVLDQMGRTSDADSARQRAGHDHLSS